jgi:hypothetical protein
MTTWLMQNVGESHEVADEYARRIAEFVDPAHWFKTPRQTDLDNALLVASHPRLFHETPRQQTRSVYPGGDLN